MASADVLSVDDDKVQCPSADYTTLQAAVAAAPQGSTITICAGTYNVPAGASAGDPKSQGLKIEKNLILRGEGADKVFVQPANTFPTIASPTPNERDEWGNVITVKRRSVELVDVQISGLTVQGNGVLVEAGIAMIDVNSGSISGVRVRDLVPNTGPGTGGYANAPMNAHGHGIVVANTLEKQFNTISVTGNSISGYNKSGIVIDGRNLAGTAPIGSTLTTTVTNNRITGAASTPIGQNGVAVWGGPNATIRGNIITSNGNPSPSEDANATAAVLLRGAGSGTLIGASTTAANANNISGNTYGVYNGDFAGAVNSAQPVNATENWWGSNGGPTVGLPKGAGDPVSGSGSVTFTPFRTAAPTLNTATNAPAAPANTAPTVVLDDPVDGSEAEGGTAVPLGAVAGDDFGVAKVEFKVGTTVVATDTTFPYTGTWTTPTVTADTDMDVTATVTDSAGATATSTIAKVTVLAPVPGPGPGTDPGPIRASPAAATSPGAAARSPAAGRPVVAGRPRAAARLRRAARRRRPIRS